MAAPRAPGRGVQSHEIADVEHQTQGRRNHDGDAETATVASTEGSISDDTSPRAPETETGRDTARKEEGPSLSKEDRRQSLSPRLIPLFPHFPRPGLGLSVPVGARQGIYAGKRPGWG